MSVVSKDITCVDTSSIEHSLNILSQFYPKVETLENFVTSVADINEHSISLEFCRYLRRSFVAYHTTDPHNLKAPLCLSKRDNYHSVLNRSVSLCWESKDLSVYSERNILCQYSNRWYKNIYTKKNVSFDRKPELVKYFSSEFVIQLYTWIGEDCFMFLLTKCSLFECLMPTVCFQRSGIPADAMLSYNLKHQKKPIQGKPECKNMSHKSIVEKLTKRKKTGEQQFVPALLSGKDQSSDAELENLLEGSHQKSFLNMSPVATASISSESGSEHSVSLLQVCPTRLKRSVSVDDDLSTNVQTKKIKCFTSEVAFETYHPVTEYCDKSNIPNDVREELFPNYDDKSIVLSDVELGHDVLSSRESEYITRNFVKPSRSNIGIDNKDTEEITKVSTASESNKIATISENDAADHLQKTSCADSVMQDRTGNNCLCTSVNKVHAEVVKKRGSINFTSRKNSCNASTLPSDEDLKIKEKEKDVAPNNNPFSVLRPIFRYSKTASSTNQSNKQSGNYLNRTSSLRKQRRQMRRRSNYCLAAGHPTVSIKRYYILYSKTFWEKPCNKLLLTALPCSEIGVNKLLDAVFKNGAIRKCCQLTEPQKSSLRPLLDVLVRKFHSWNYMKSLNLCCPVPQDFCDTDMKGLLHYNCPYSAVVNFVSSSFRQIVPTELLGSVSNYENFVMQLEDLISSSKAETLWLHKFMSKLKVLEIKWLTCTDYCRIQFFQVVYFLVDIVLGLLKSFFYVTENSSNKYQLYFYRKRVWQRIHTLEMNRLQKTGIIHNVTAEKKGNTSAFENWPHYKLRFIPKLSSLRCIMVPVEPKVDPVTLAVKAVFACPQLKNRIVDANHVFGCLKRLHAHRKIHNDTRPLYFVLADIENCYTHILQDKLLSLCQDHLNKLNAPSFEIIRMAVIRRESQLKARHILQAIPKGESHLGAVCQFKSMSVVTIQRTVGELTCAMLCSQLEKYVKRYIIKVGNCFYRVARGIQQGGILSTTLCNLYLDALMKKHLSNFGDKEDEVLIRVADDFLYATPDLKKADHFASILQAGFDDFGCSINKEKIVLNFQVTDIEPLKEGEPVRYVGLTIDPKYLNIGVDYSRRSKVSLRYRMTFSGRNPGITAREKLRHYIVHSTPYIVLDMEINTKHVVIKNLFERFLMVSCQFHSILKFHFEVSNISQTFVMHLILDVAACMSRRIQIFKKKNHISCSITCYEVELICIKAFLHMMQCHRTFYSELRKLILRLRLSCEKKLSKKKAVYLSRIIKHHSNRHFNKMLQD